MTVHRYAVLGYGAVAYTLFLGVFAYTIGFLANVGVPKGIDDGVSGSLVTALGVDAGLLALFALQHSVMARPWFKRRWTRVVAPSIERSTYVLLSSLVLGLLLWQWRPLPDPVWTVDNGVARAVLWALYALGWILLLFSSYLIDHFDLFGLRQVVARARDRAYVPPSFGKPLLYRLVRHPLLVGFLIAFWATPDMSVGRLLFAVGTTGYILVGARLEEHDLRAELGEPYERYLRETPRFIPRPSGVTGRQRAADHA